MRLANITPPSVTDGIHLNIGCGSRLWPGFVNLDYPGNWSGEKPDIECDVRQIPLPNDYADSAYAIHVLEHIYRWDTEKTLQEWKRVLKPGGQLILELPCLDRIISAFLVAAEKKQPINEQLTMWRLYGDPIYENEHMVHKWAFSVSELTQLMEQAGFKEVEASAPVWHHPQGDMRVTGIK